MYDDELAAGTRAGAYIIGNTLGAGGCGTVYRAQDSVLGRQVAIKVLHRDLVPSPSMLERFVREARAMSRLRHPNIVDVFAFGQLLDGRPFYVMELLEGTDLDACIHRHGGFSPPKALAILEPVCRALRQAHAAGVIHRDLKASNVFLGASVKLLDFGIAKLLQAPYEAGHSSSSRRLGTPSSMAPEQIRGEPVDERTDIYALGVLAFHVLTGRLPFEGADRDETERQQLEMPPPRASRHAPVGEMVDRVLLRALEKQPDRRFSSVNHFLAHLTRALDPAATLALPRVTTLPALAICVAARVEAGATTAQLERVQTVLGELRDIALRHGFQVILESPNTLLLARALVADAEAEACRLAQRIDPALGFDVTVRTGMAAARGNLLIGGSLLQLSAFARRF